MSEEQKNQETVSDKAQTPVQENKPAQEEKATTSSTENNDRKVAKPADNREGQQRSDRPYKPKRDFGGGEGGGRMPRFKRKVCRFCHDKNAKIDYKESDVLLKFVTDRGKILPRRVTGTCAKHQRAVAREIKRARSIALLPFIEM